MSRRGSVGRVAAAPPTRTEPAPASVAAAPYQQDLDAERLGWYEFVGIVRSLTPEECLVPGYYEDPYWTIRDLAAHIGTWLAEAEVQLERMIERDLRGPRDRYRRAERHVPRGHARPAVGGLLRVQANAARSRVLTEWFGQPGAGRGGRMVDPQVGVRAPDVSTWPRLRTWAAELRARRPPSSRIIRSGWSGRTPLTRELVTVTRPHRATRATGSSQPRRTARRRSPKQRSAPTMASGRDGTPSI